MPPGARFSSEADAYRGIAANVASVHGLRGDERATSLDPELPLADPAAEAVAAVNDKVGACVAYYVHPQDPKAAARDTVAVVQFSDAAALDFRRLLDNDAVERYPPLGEVNNSFFEIEGSRWSQEARRKGHLDQRHFVLVFEDAVIECLGSAPQTMGFAEGEPSKILAGLMGDGSAWRPDVATRRRMAPATEEERLELLAVMDELRLQNSPAGPEPRPTPFRPTPAFRDGWA